MSLKSFHIFFIVVSIIFAIGFGLWILSERPMEIEAMDLFAALLSFSVAGALCLYVVRFLRKFKNLRFM